MPNPTIAIIADDLTGAMDAAAPFATRGAITRVVVSPSGIGQLADTLSDDVQVISVNTETRHASAEQAAQDTGRAIAALAELSPYLLFKKIDSTMRGHVATETIAALRASGRSQAVVTPALPAQGRTVEKGAVFVHGVALKDTAIGRDLLSPPPSTPIPELLRKADPALTVQLIEAGGVIPAAEDQAEGQVSAVVADCQTQDHLTALARRIVLAGADTLLVGAAGLSEGIAALLFDAPPPPPTVQIHGPGLFVVGSRAPESIRQTDMFLDTIPRTTVLEIADGKPIPVPDLPALSQDNGQDLILIRPAPEDAGLSADRVAASLAESARRLLDAQAMDLLVMTGGDTARAVLALLDQESITVSGEILPGIVFGRITVNERPLWLVTKAGGFGDDRLFLDIERFFRPSDQ